jgi:hypothetical protein
VKIVGGGVQRQPSRLIARADKLQDRAQPHRLAGPLGAQRADVWNLVGRR